MMNSKTRPAYAYMDEVKDLAYSTPVIATINYIDGDIYQIIVPVDAQYTDPDTEKLVLTTGIKVFYSEASFEEEFSWEKI